MGQGQYKGWQYRTRANPAVAACGWIGLANGIGKGRDFVIDSWSRVCFEIHFNFFSGLSSCRGADSADCDAAEVLLGLP